MITRLIISSLAVIVASLFIDGVSIEPWHWCVVVAVVLGLLNTFVKPIIKLLALPINIITLGLFTFVINTAMVLLCAYCIPDEHFHVDGLSSAFFFSVVLWIVNWLLTFMFKED